jgi:(E)-4-hydroxy-3-methylbut-2-enyl-diphosphate synthase
VKAFTGADVSKLETFLSGAESSGSLPVVSIDADDVEMLAATLKKNASVLITLRAPASPVPAPAHAIGSWRKLVESLRQHDVRAPVWIRNTAATEVRHRADFLSRVLESSILSGSLLADGIGDAISIETESNIVRATRLAYNVLQGAGARISKTEFVACPSCGRTLFDLQSTTQRIRSQTGHLKGVKIAIMGCIVNGPGEMADADFGYVGGAPGKINLYVGKECVRYNIPATEADQRLIELIKDHGKWTNPDPVEATS